jgi:hypothetical protein
LQTVETVERSCQGQRASFPRTRPMSGTQWRRFLAPNLCPSILVASCEHISAGVEANATGQRNSWRAVPCTCTQPAHCFCAYRGSCRLLRILGIRRYAARSAAGSFVEMRANGSSLKATADASSGGSSWTSAIGWVKEAFDNKPHVSCVCQPSPIMESLVTKTSASRPWMCRL